MPETTTATQEPSVGVGKIAFILLTGEPVFVLDVVRKIASVVDLDKPIGSITAIEAQQLQAQYIQQQIPYADFAVRRFNAGQNGTFYNIEYFTAAELTAKAPNNTRNLLDQLFPAENVIEIETEADEPVEPVLPQKKAVDYSVN